MVARNVNPSVIPYLTMSSAGTLWLMVFLRWAGVRSRKKRASADESSQLAKPLGRVDRVTHSLELAHSQVAIGEQQDRVFIFGLRGDDRLTAFIFRRLPNSRFAMDAGLCPSTTVDSCFVYPLSDAGFAPTDA